MLPGQLEGTVQDSKAKRQERLKSRFRDRGGIFVPAEGNALAQVLLARGVNGESPIKRRSPRKSTATRNTTPKSARSAKVATKTPRTASKRARKSVVVPGANLADEDTIAPASAKKNKGRSTPNSKTPKSQSQRSRPRTKGVGFDGDDDGGDSAGPSRPHAPIRPKSSANQLADARISANSALSLAPSASSLQGSKRVIGKGKPAGTHSASTTTAVDLGRKVPQSPSLGGGRAARRRPRGRDYDSNDHSDMPLAQKQAKKAPASKSDKRTDTKDAPRPPPARKKRATPKAKADTNRITEVADDADGNEQTKRTAAIASIQKGATTEATAGREASVNSRKRGAEEGHGHDEPPHGGEDLPGVVLPPTKRARVPQEKGAPRKRKERAKNVDDGNDAIRTADNENENGPPTKKRLRADPQTATAVSRRRPGKENENGMEQSKPARKASKGATNKTLLSPTGANRKTTSKGKPKGKPPLRSGGTRARSRGLPPDVLRRIKVNAQTIEAEIDDDDPIDFLRS